jgi:hypothetical protein
MGLPADVQNTLEVFKYACTHKNTNVSWDKNAIQSIEKKLLSDPKLERLHALIYQNASARKQLDWFERSTQALLKRTTYAIVADIAAKRAFIHKLTAALERNNISIILLKGMAFNDALYSAAAPRGTSDIDILIKPADKAKFELVLKELAKPVEVDNGHPFDGLYEQTWIAIDGVNQFIDVHTNLTNPILFDISSEMLWNCSMPHPAYLSSNLRILNTEHTICHLVTHMINDTNFFHYNLIDMQQLILKQQIDVSLLEKTALKWGVFNATKYLLKVVHDYLASPLIIRDTQQHFLPSIRLEIASFVINKLFTIGCNEKSFVHRLKQLFCYAFVVDQGKTVYKVISHYIICKIRVL